MLGDRKCVPWHTCHHHYGYVRWKTTLLPTPSWEGRVIKVISIYNGHDKTTGTLFCFLSPFRNTSIACFGMSFNIFFYLNLIFLL